MIRKLPQDTWILIAAGQIVDYARDVIKELIENSLDANATIIDIFFYKDYKIAVQDNGIGMNKDDLLLCKEPHATSKFTSLDNISQFGFRGEALHIISQVSNCTIMSKHNNTAYTLYSDNRIEQCVMNEGTKIIIENFLYNIPARKSFLKPYEYEYRCIVDLIWKYVYCYSNIKFRLINHKQTYTFQDERSHIKIKIDEKSKDFHIHGYLYYQANIENKSEIPKIHKDEKDSFHLYVNNRSIQDYKITKAIKDKTDLPFLLFINCNYDLVNVNVHPKKKEVRFLSNPIPIILLAIENALSEFKPLNSKSHIINSLHNSLDLTMNISKENEINNWKFHDSSKPSLLEKSNITKSNITDILNFISEKTENKLDNYDHICKKEDSSLSEEIIEKEIKEKDLSNSLNLKENLCDVHNNELQDTHINIIDFTLFGRYMICTQKDDFIFIDMHAAHERVISENLHLPQEKALLINPIIIEIDYKTYEKLSKDLYLNNICHISLQENQFICYALPTYINQTNLFIRKLLQQGSKEALLYFVHEYGCHNAIYSGKNFTIQEKHKLLENILNSPHAAFCNHGRPVFWKLSKAAIDYKFKR